MCSIFKFESANKENVCFFCYKSCTDNKNTEVLKSFKKFAGRCIGNGFETSLNAAENELLAVLRGEQGLVCCDSCGILLGSFCEIYDHLKYWELRLEWRLRGLLDIMKVANRVPSRVIHLKQLFLEATEHDGNELQNKTGNKRLKSFKKFRRDAILKCNHKLSNSLPKVLVTCFRKNNRCNSSLAHPVKIDYKSETQTSVLPTAEEWFYQWVISLITVGMLVFTPFQNFTPDFFPEEQITTLDLSDILESEGLRGVRSAENICKETTTSSSVTPTPEISTDPIIDTKCPQKFISRNRVRPCNKDCSTPNKRFNCGLCKSRQISYRALKIHKLTSIKHNPLMSLNSKTNQNIRAKRQRLAKATHICVTLNEHKVKKESMSDAQHIQTEIKSENIDDITTFSNSQRYNLRKNRKRLYTQVKEESEHEEKNEHSDSETTDPDTDDTDWSSLYSSKNEETTNDRTNPDTILSSSLSSSDEDDIKVLNCDVCKLRVPKYHMKKHFKRWHDMNGQALDSKDIRKCPNSECTAYFLTGKNAKGTYKQLALHMKNVHQMRKVKVKKEVKVKAKKKTKTIKAETSEDKNIESENENVSMHECLKCQALGIYRKFRLLCNYQDHGKFHKEGIFQCNFCEKTEKDIVALSVHEMKNHTKKKTDSKENIVFSCPRCETEHCSKWMYTEHFADTHIPDFDTIPMYTRVECDVCQYEIKKIFLAKHFSSFHDKRNLSNGILECTHPRCPAYFVWKTSKAWAEHQLQFHIRHVHENIDEFQNFDNNPNISKRKRAGYKCKLCGNSFASKLGTYHHIIRCRRRNAASRKTTYKNVFFECPVENCKSNFVSRKNFEKHEKFHGRFSCRFCTVLKEYAPDLALHELNEHSEKVEDSNIRCSRCPSKFHFKPAFIDHFLETHLKLETETIGYCTICGAETIVIKKERFLRLHFRDCHNTEGLDPKDIHRCDQCQAYFIKPLQLYLHKMNFHFKRKCPGCGKSYKTLPQLKYHIEICQPDSLPLAFTCDMENCSRKFSTAEKLDHHKKFSRHEQPGKIYKCTKCSKQYKKYGVLQTHLRQAHGPKSFLCSECGKAFSSKARLDLHFELHKETNRDKFKFQCVECGKKFRIELTLERHMGTHTNEKPFVCQYCGNSYKHKVGLTRHVKTSHIGKPSG